jgi:hypothetical protein
MNKSGRPTKTEALAIAKRDVAIIAMDKNGYPRDYIAAYSGLTEGRIAQIISKNKGREEDNQDDPDKNEVPDCQK